MTTPDSDTPGTPDAATPALPGLEGAIPEPTFKRTGRSQHNEHEYILGFFKGEDLAKLRVLDIGAADGVDMSNTIDLVDAGASATLIEASPHEFVRLARNMAPYLDRVTLVHAAVGRYERLQLWHDSNGNFVSTTVEAHRKLWAYDPETNPTGVTFTPMYVLTCPLGKILRGLDVPVEYDFVNIDTEGANLEVAEQMCRCIRLYGLAPRLVCIETEPSVPGMEDDLVRLMRTHGYEVVHRIEINLFFRPIPAGENPNAQYP